ARPSAMKRIGSWRRLILTRLSCRYSFGNTTEKLHSCLATIARRQRLIMKTAASGHMYSSVKLRVRRGLDCTIRNVLDRGHARLARPGGIPELSFRQNGRQATALQLHLHLDE